jgi:hypothetical protein
MTKKTPSNFPLLQLAKENGLKVYAKHYRIVLGCSDPVAFATIEDLDWIQFMLIHGGKTTVTLVDPLEVAVVGYGEAVCSSKPLRTTENNFNRRVGFNFAFRRAFEEFAQSLGKKPEDLGWNEECDQVRTWWEDKYRIGKREVSSEGM